MLNLSQFFNITGMFLGIVILLYSEASGADFYVYRAQDGTTWYTDHRLPGEKYTLLATIGRPAATVSCNGVTSAAMERRALSHAATIEQYAQIYNVDHLMVKAIIRIESCFDKYAVSSVGAKGLMQLMPSTAKRMGVQNVFNPEDNIRGGIRYFSLMMKKFNQDTELALAAYNAGPGAVEKHKGIPPFKETQRYVKRVLDIYGRYRAAES